MRYKKVVNGNETEYYLDGSTIIAENRKVGATNNLIYYIYDTIGLSGMVYNGENYYYIKNTQSMILDLKTMLDSTKLTHLQTALMLLTVLFFSSIKILEFKQIIMRRCKNKKLRSLPYFRKNFFARIFLLGLGNVIELELFVLNFIEKTNMLLISSLGILHLIFYNTVFSRMFKICILIELGLLVISGFMMGSFRPYKRRD